MVYALEVKQLSKDFCGLKAVNNLSFEVQEGEIFGFLGPNGAGKTTSILMMTGLLRPTRGSVSVFGLDIVKHRRQAQEKMGVIFEKSLYPRLSARENLQFYAQLLPRNSQYGIDELLNLVGLKAHSNRLVKGFSRGMRQRLEIARALLHKPRLLFLDEPTVGLDPVIARRIRNLIRELNHQGVTMILTTHYMEEADSLCDNVGFICDGKLVAKNTPSCLKKELACPILSVKVRNDSGAAIHDYFIELSKPEDRQKLQYLLAENRVVEIQQQKPSLEDVFIAVTGRGLHETDISNSN